MDDTQSYPMYNTERPQAETYIPMTFFNGSQAQRPIDVDRTLQEMLADNIDSYVVCEFLIGTQNMTTKEGILHEIGSSFFVLYHPLEDTYESCDFYSVKFVTFYREDQSGTRPQMPQTPIQPRRRTVRR